MRRLPRAFTGFVTAAGVTVTYGLLVAAAGPAWAQATCNGKPVTSVVTINKGDYKQYNGTSGDDVVLVRGDGFPHYAGKGGDDTICVRSHEGGTIDGGPGSDWISAQWADRGMFMAGGDGGDTVIGTPELDLSVEGDAGNDIVRGLGGGDALYGDGGYVYNQTDDAPDVTTDGADTVYGGSGDDRIHVAMRAPGKTTGSDDFFGGSGHDRLSLSGEAVHLRAGEKTVSTINGGPTDHFRGMQAYDGTEHADVLEGSDHGESIFTYDGADKVYGHGGDDRVAALGAGTIVRAGTGNDTFRLPPLAGQAKDVTVRLGKGEDTAQLLAGKTFIHGGAGSDTFRVKTRIHNPDAGYVISGAVYGSSGRDSLVWDCKAKVNVAEHHFACRGDTLSVSGIQRYDGWRKADVFRGGPAGDDFHGHRGDDSMYGHGGNDTLIGGKGVDTAWGGRGNDTCRAEHKTGC